MAFHATAVRLGGKVGPRPFRWSNKQSTKYGYGKNFALQTNQRKVVQHQGMQGWSQHKLGRRGWRYEYFKEGGPEEKNVKKIMWGDFAAKMPTSVYFQPGVINGTDPNEQGLIKKPIAPEFAGSYEARPWVAPDVFPDNHPLTRMPAPVRNVVAQAERKKNFWSKDQWYEMAEGEVLCPFEVLEFDVRRAGMMMKGGRHMRTLVTVIVSNGNGVAGLGVGEGRTYEEARQAGIRYAFGNLIARDPDDRTVPHPVYENFNETRVSLLPANTLACSPVVADVMSGFGFQGASVKIKRSRHRKYKKLMTLFAAIRQVRSMKVIAQQRGMSLTTMKKPLFTFLENARRKRGMFEMSPDGRTGFLPPNRVIDNRLPDSLKKRYFGGTEDENFGYIASSDTFRKDSGTERYGKRNAPYVSLEADKGDEMSQYTVESGDDYVPLWSKGVQTQAREEWLG